MNEISNFFNAEVKDIPIKDKYIITDKKINNNHPFNKYYRTYRIKKPFVNYTYMELKEACNKILSSDLSSTYIKYRRVLDNYIFKYLKYPVDYKLINESISIIYNIIDNKEIEYNLIASKYTEDFLDSYFSNSINSFENILSITNLTNKKYNYELLNKSSKNKWFRLFNNENKIKDEENLKLFSNIHEEIYNEYINNYNSINKLEEKLLFLKSILTEDRYNEEIIEIIKNENVHEKLIFYKNILEITYQNKTTFSQINNLSKVEEEILKYCYDDLEEKQDLDKLISIIPLLKLYLDIEEEEVKHLDIIKLYKEYDNTIVSIYEDDFKKKSLISNGIINLWDNKLRDGYSVLTENISNLSEESLNKFFPIVISTLSENSINNLISKKFNFEKIVIVSDTPSEYKEFQNQNQNLYLLSKNIIYINSYNNINILNTVNDKNYINKVQNEILSELKFNLLNRFSNIKAVNNKSYLELMISNNKIQILLNNNYNNEVDKDIFNYKYYIDNNIYIYRLWYRDWWLNKLKEIDNICEYIKEIDNDK